MPLHWSLTKNHTGARLRKRLIADFGAIGLPLFSDNYHEQKDRCYDVLCEFFENLTLEESSKKQQASDCRLSTQISEETLSDRKGNAETPESVKPVLANIFEKNDQNPPRTSILDFENVNSELKRLNDPKSIALTNSYLESEELETRLIYLKDTGEDRPMSSVIPQPWHPFIDNEVQKAIRLLDHQAFSDIVSSQDSSAYGLFLFKIQE